MDTGNLTALLTRDIKKKRELSGISSSVVEKELNEYFKRYDKDIGELREVNDEKKIRKNSAYRKIIKKIREKLHFSFGMFQIPSNQENVKSEFLKKLKVNQATEKDYKQILSLHLSTKERIPFYPFIYEQIFKNIKAKTILDLGCGMNPVSAYYLPSGIKYIASDIDKANLLFIEYYFKYSGIDGKTLLLDLAKETDRQKLAFIESDICFMFKLLETDKRIAEEIITAVNSKYLIVSFSTLSLAGKIMSSPEREWLEKLLKRINYSFKTFKTANEIFYVIRKT